MRGRMAYSFLVMGTCGFALSFADTAIAKPPEARLTIEHSFSADEGRGPSLEATLVRGHGHELYGVLGTGGQFDNGSAYSFNFKNGHLQVLHAFAPDDVSEVRPSAIWVDAAGAVLVTTYQGGDSHIGTISRIEGDGTLTVLHSFDGESGGLPGGPLTADGDAIVGTTGSGPLGFGTVYRFGGDAGFELLHAFDSASSLEESFPFNVTRGSTGALYGATTGYVAPQANYGTLYSLTSAGEYQVLHYFTGADGARPQFAPVFGAPGVLFGTTYEGGEFGCGVVYRLVLPATLSVVHSFDRDVDGCMPFGGLILSENGNLYGTTFIGGKSDVGTFFEVSPGGRFRTLLDFDAAKGEGLVQTSLLEVERGVFYGTSGNGGRFGLGAIFRIKVK